MVLAACWACHVRRVVGIVPAERKVGGVRLMTSIHTCWRVTSETNPLALRGIEIVIVILLFKRIALGPATSVPGQAGNLGGGKQTFRAVSGY